MADIRGLLRRTPQHATSRALTWPRQPFCAGLWPASFATSQLAAETQPGALSCRSSLLSGSHPGNGRPGSRRGFGVVSAVRHLFRDHSEGSSRSGPHHYLHGAHNHHQQQHPPVTHVRHLSHGGRSTKVRLECRVQHCVAQCCSWYAHIALSSQASVSCHQGCNGLPTGCLNVLTTCTLHTPSRTHGGPCINWRQAE